MKPSSAIMSHKYKFHNKEGLYFVSLAIDYSGGKGLLEIDFIG